MTLSFGRQHRAAAIFSPAVTGKFFFELCCVTLVDRQAVVVIELFAGAYGALCFDKDAAVYFVAFAIGIAGVVNPFSPITLHTPINNAKVIDVKIKSVMGLQRVMRMTAQRLLPSNELTFVFDDSFIFFDGRYGENAASVNG